MNSRADYFRHSVALAAIFILGEGCLTFPVNGANRFGILGFALAAVLIFPVFIGVFYLSKKVLGGKNLCFRIISPLLLMTFSVFALFCGADSFLRLAGFAEEIMLPDSPRFFICLIFGIAVLYFGLKKSEDILKFSVISIVLVAGVILFFLVAAADKYTLRNIYVFSLPSFRDLFSQFKPYAATPLLHSAILPIFFVINFQNSRLKSGLLGVGIGIALLFACLVPSVLLFGFSLAGELQYPFNSLVSTVTVGRLFTRLDSFAYFVYFVCSLIKIAVIVNTVKTCVLKTRDCIDNFALSK